MADVAEVPLSNLAQRLITAAVVGPIVVVAGLWGGLPFALLVTVVAVVGVIEFYVLARNRPAQGSTVTGVPILLGVILAFFFHEPLIALVALVAGAVATFALETLRHHQDVKRSLAQVGMTLLGVLYVGFPSAFLIGIRMEPDGKLWLLLILCVTWGTDSFAYVGGRLWGKTKLAPAISPKKTLEGAVVGIIGGIIPSLLLLHFADRLSMLSALLVLICPLVAILGDLVESSLKRFFQVKDSHVEGLDILPGHGGVLDRIDGLLLVIAAVWLFFLLTGLR